MSNHIAARSVLYVPAANPRALAKLSGLQADVVILDLEDSAADDAKPEARERIRALYADLASGALQVSARLGIRVNASDTPHHAADLALLADCQPALAVLPKVESADDLCRFADQAQAAQVWAMIETPRGVLQASAIATANARVGGLMLGLEDLGKAMAIQVAADRWNVLFAMQQVALAAKAANAVAIDGVHRDLNDEAGFVAACAQAKAMGYDGKSLIHPKTLPACHAAFSPSDAEIAQARAIIDAYAQARAEGLSVGRLGDTMVEGLHAEQAQALLARAGLSKTYM